MSRAYSNKALPSGTIVREWRLEEVLGVGGFGIVYKGRGIYFNELVAIKEYFPSSISERDSEDTVVPIDSDAEEVHALGLKKFVEEAKLLWNLSTPSRHPNIVNVRSLFEIHGTAYMVMDFEDGTSLSKLLKEGKRFNERSLLDLVRPIAEGLDRAHRVGVLHRDIKPPNILINEDGRPVLIDFGSARFEAAEATSTKVTFHTPPYAAIEQYVKTYDQGPWTDIYALGVVLYECVTGTKPPEVLERLHGAAGGALAGEKWPGYSRRFLAAIDSAMTIRPSDRPQSIVEWLALFDGAEHKPARTVSVDFDDEATRVVAFDTPADQIAPVAPPASEFPADEPIKTGVPASPAEAKFNRAGHDTGAEKVPPPVRDAAAAALAAGEAAAAPARPTSDGDDTSTARQARSVDKAGPPAARKRVPVPVLAGGAALVLVAVVGGAWGLSSDRNDAAAEPAEAISAGATAPEAVVLGAAAVAQVLPTLQTLQDEARSAGAPGSAVAALSAAAMEVTQLGESQGPAAEASADEIRRLSAEATAQFAADLQRNAEARAQRLSAEVPWANPARSGSASRLPADRRRAAANVRDSLASLRSAVAETSAAEDLQSASAAARRALAQYSSFAAAADTAYRRQAVAAASEERKDPPTATAEASPRRASAPVTPVAAGAETSRASASAAVGPATPATLGQLREIVKSSRSMAKEVIKLGDRKAGSGATARQKEGHGIRRANVALARNYDSNLATLQDSIRGVTNESEAQRLMKQTKQTQAYVQFLLKRSTETLSW